MSEPPNVSPRPFTATRNSTSQGEMETLSSGIGVRLDQAHVRESLPETVAASVDLQAEFPPEELADGGYDRLLLQAGQIAQQLQKQAAELDRREHRLHAQLVQLDQERRAVRLWVSQTEQDLRERETELAARETDCDEKTAACLQLDRELQELHQTLLREQHTLAQERGDFTTACEAQRQALAEERESQTTSLAAERDAQTAALAAERAAQATELAAERAAQTAELTAEREQHQQEQTAQRQALAEERTQQQTEFRQERALLENRLRFQQEHLQKSRQEFETAQAEFRLEQQLSRANQSDIQQQIRLRSGQLQRVRELLDSREQSLEREEQWLAKARRAHESQCGEDLSRLQAERQAWEEERETQQADLRRQQDMLALHAENLETRRLRLDRLRSELEETNRNSMELRVAVEEAFAQLGQVSGVETARQQVEQAHDILTEHYRHTRTAIARQQQELEQQHEQLIEQHEKLQQERQTLTGWLNTQTEQLRARAVELETGLQSQQIRERDWQAAHERWTADKLEAERVIRDLLRQLEDQAAGS